MLFRGISVAILGLCGCGAAPAPAADDAVHIRAYYQGTLFTASYREAAGITNRPASTLYEADSGMASGDAFVSVLGGSVENRVWREVQVSGCAGALCAVPFQLRSEEEVLGAVDAGAIHLIETDSLCNVLDVRPMKSLQR
jgi:hypothetical protein